MPQGEVLTFLRRQLAIFLLSTQRHQMLGIRRQVQYPLEDPVLVKVFFRLTLVYLVLLGRPVWQFQYSLGI